MTGQPPVDRGRGPVHRAHREGGRRPTGRVLLAAVLAVAALAVWRLDAGNAEEGRGPDTVAGATPTGTLASQTSPSRTPTSQATPTRTPTSQTVTARPSPSASPSATATETDAVGTYSTRIDGLAATRGQPVQVRIPALDVVADVTAVGLAEDHAKLALPDSATQLAWWAFGAAPGESSGTVLIAGHVAWDGQAGALADLAEVPMGATVTVKRAHGAPVTYRVERRRQTHKSSLADLGLFTTSGSPQLVLVTCGGRYLPARHAWEDNVIINASPVT